MTCLEPGRKGIGITFGRRDAQGLTFSVVIQTRVMQPGDVMGGKQNWRIALCSYGMAFAPCHLIHSDETFAPPLRAPARVIPGRTLVEGEGRVGYRASPQLQSTPLFRRRWLSAVPIPVPPEPKSAQRFTRFSIAIAIEVAVPLSQQLLGFGIGADLLAAVPAPAAEIPGAGDAPLNLPYAKARATGPFFCF